MHQEIYKAQNLSMKDLTEKEEEVMRKLWTSQEMTARQVWEMYPEPRPHFNTVSTFIHILEKKGWVKHRPIGNTNLYSAVVSQEEVGKRSLKNVITKFFKGSVTGMISALLQEEKLSDEQIKDLIEMVESNKESK